jgi:hypothetical protein
MKREGLMCRSCGKEGHIAKACRGRNGKEVQREVTEETDNGEAMRAVWDKMAKDEQTRWLQGLLSKQQTDNESLKE